MTTNQKPAAGPRRVRIYNPQLDRVRVGSNESCGVHKPPFKSYELDPRYWDNFTEFIEVSAYSQLAEQLERYKGMWESECARGNRHLDKLMLAERALEQARKERDEAIRQADALANMIESLFCNPEGRASFEGSQGDKDIFNQGFEKFKAWRRGEG